MPVRAGLDRAAVVSAAAALADQQGLDEVTLGALAARLGVRTPSLYNHVEGLSGLRGDLALFGLKELTARVARAAIGKSADDAVLALARAYRTFARERPGLFAASIRPPDPANPALQAAAQELIEIVLAVLVPFGLHGDQAIHAVRALRSVVHGFVSLEAAGGFAIPLDLDESFEYLIRIYLRGLHSPNEVPQRDGVSL